MLFSGVVPLFFTLFLLTWVTNQGNCWSCVAHAVTACGKYAGYSMSGVWGWLVDRGASCASGTRTSQLDGYLTDKNISFTKISSNSGEIIKELTAWLPVVASLQNLRRYETKEIKVFSGYIEKEWKVGNKKFKYKKKQYKTISIKDPIMPVYSTGSEWHAVCVIGYNSSGAVFQNSFGASYGERGFGIVKREDIEGEFWRIEK